MSTQAAPVLALRGADLTLARELTQKMALEEVECIGDGSDGLDALMRVRDLGYLLRGLGSGMPEHDDDGDLDAEQVTTLRCVCAMCAERDDERISEPDEVADARRAKSLLELLPAEVAA